MSWVKIAAVSAILILMILAVAIFWPAPKVEQPNRWAPAAAPKVVEKIRTVMVPVKQLVVIEKKKAAEALKLPEAIARNEAKQITASSIVNPSESRTTVATVIDTETGQTEILQREEALPLFGLESKKEVYLQAGLSTRAGKKMELGAHWDFARIAKAHIGVYGKVNTEPEAQVGVRLSYRW